MIWPDGVVVVTPTIPQRRPARHVTLDQWRALGADPIIVEQDESIPIGPKSHLTTSRAAIGCGLDTGAELIVFAEDDIDIDPRLVGILPSCVGNTPVSLWHRPRFRPRRIPPACGGVAIVPAVAMRQWWGSQCVAMSRHVARSLITTEPDNGVGGWDICLRSTRLRITVPALVEHRPGRRYATRAHGHVVSDTYQGPRHGW